MKYIIALILVCYATLSFSQTIISGPMIGHTEFRTAIIWLQLKENIDASRLKLTVQQSNASDAFSAVKDDNKFFNIYRFQLTNLQPGQPYQYTITNKGKQIAQGSVTTQQLWQWRKPSPDFSFITGSCAYINHPQFDRWYSDAPKFTKRSTPYGGDSSIFASMAAEKADFMLWLGDNWYTREVDYYSAWGLNERASTDRGTPIIQPLLKAMPQYAIWDDHDYGPNDSDKSYYLKEDSRKAFKSFWANPSYGLDNEGIFTKYTWNDVDFFLLDDRWYRSNDEMPDSINGVPNKNKTMFGEKQMEWLKNALLQSRANRNINFRIIATGSQVLNPVSPYDCFRKFSAEYNDLMQFLNDNRINGVVFLTGDRHHSEIIKIERPGAYPLVDITSSPLTSGTHKFDKAEKDNPYRVLGIAEKQNYTRISFSGVGYDRVLTATFLGVNGENLGQWSIKASELSHPRKER